MKKPGKLICIMLSGMIALSLGACNVNVYDGSEQSKDRTAAETVQDDQQPAKKNGEVMILFTSDVHCGVDQGFGYAGLAQIRDNYEKQGYETILVDDGDEFQGETIGTVTKGQAIVEIMNELKYDVAIPGNHDFDYGMDRFLELVGEADYPYISCNFNRQGELVFEPYIIKEAAGMKIAFVGVTTPTTLTQSAPAYFMDENGNHIYGFFQDDTGKGVYDAVQKAVDDARAEGADYVYLVGHMGNEEECRPWTYEDVLSNTNGIDVMLDGHSHDTEQVVMKNRDGDDVVRSACGYKLNCIGYSHITAEGIEDTNILSWPNKKSMPDVLGISNEVGDKVSEELAGLDEEINDKIGYSDVELMINDPEARDESDNPIRMIRKAETNLGDFCADVFRNSFGTDIAIMNGGGIRTGIDKGDITYKNIIDVFPFGNQLCVIEVTGQQILDALEWGARSAPDENGAFLQVSGLTYEINTKIPNACKADENGMCVSIEGQRRVGNVMVGDEPIDPDKKYTLAGIDYTLFNHGDGYTAFDGAKIIEDRVKLDNQVLIDYITDNLGGTIGEEYEDPRGQGRIRIIE